MKILLLDIECAPNLATVWGIWQQNVALNQLLESSYTLCYAAKFYGESKIMFDSIYKTDRKHMLKSIHELMESADVIVHYNGLRFDIPMLNKEFLEAGMNPPSPVKHIDLLRVVKSNFRFVSNKLDYVSQRLGIGKKTAHEGHELWLKVMNNNRAAWKRMEEYNKNDVVLLESLYDRLKGWIKSHPNHNAYSDEICCINCGSRKLHKRGEVRSRTSIFQRFQCQSCGAWSRSNKSQKVGKESLVNI
jgi:DNA polymerase elongation subunit (family B)